MKRRILAVAVATLAAGCGAAGAAARPSASADPVTGTVTVLAASSLRTVLGTLAGDFEREHPGAHVRTTFAGSDSLAASIVAGAPGTVFLAASPATMATVVRAGDTAAAPVTVTRNVLELAVAPGNPLHLDALAALTRPGVTVVLCAPSVPCGAAAARAFASQHLSVRPASLESDVAAVLTKVELREADAGIVYRTDVRAAGDKVTGVPLTGAAQVRTDYLAAPLTGSGAVDRAFIDLLRSATGQQVLAAAGFGG